MTDPRYQQPYQPEPYRPSYGQQPAQPQQPYPSQPGYPQAGYPQPGYPQAGYPQPGYPQHYAAAGYGVDPATGMPLSDKSKIVAGLLQLFLGGFGVGRFYLGYNGIGAAQLSLWLLGFVTSFFLIGFIFLFALTAWVLIDAVLIFTGSVPDAQGRVLRS